MTIIKISPPLRRNGTYFSLQLEKEVPYLRHCKSTLNPIGVIRAVSMAMNKLMDLQHFSGLLNRSDLLKKVQGLSAPFLPNPRRPIPAIGNAGPAHAG